MLIQLTLPFKYLLKYILIILILIFSSCNRSDLQDSIDMNWIKSDKYYPNYIQLYSGYDSNIPIRAWVVVIPKNNNNRFKVLISDDDDGVETPQDFSNENEALVVINGGYFLRGASPVRHVGLLKSGGELIEPASKSVIREKIRYDIARGAIGFFDNGDVDISWASTRNDSILYWDTPINNRPGKPVSIDYSKSKYWNVVDALHAGPILISNGKINVTSEQEVFFNTPVDGVQPRSAIGYNKDGDLIIMVVDGRQVDSRGAYLKELAILMSQFDCFEALNLDGGGSSALVLNGELINRPIGLRSQREVMSSIAVFSKD